MQPKFDYESCDDLALARLVEVREPEAVRLVTSRNNQRLFRAAWSILKNHAEAEDVVQSTYLSAFAAIRTFEGLSTLSTWLMRIAINEALGRRRAGKRRRAHLDENKVTDIDEYREKLMRGSTGGLSPEGSLAREQLRLLIEQAVARLPDAFRLVFVLREIEGMSIAEASDVLGVTQATVKTRLYRAKKRLQTDLAPEVKSALDGAFPFAGADCAAMNERVLRAFCGGGQPLALRGSFSFLVGTEA
ncbi:MAG TPA: RNA polymerase sigma factor [Sphingomicrobium sp.]|nr:RNA polymerase sigma factor [Sphingomicrobium sp.]